jgi:uncharacterized protein involved in response to NO
VQPRIEGALIIILAVATLAALSTGARGAAIVQGTAMVVAGVLAALRLLRWRPWAVRGRPDLLCLSVGYAWLSVGIGLFGASLVSGNHQVAALHVLMVGSVGTLTINVMAMTHALTSRRRFLPAHVPVWSTLLIGAATVLRVASAIGVGEYRLLSLAASLCWSGAFALLLVLLVRR